MSSNSSIFNEIPVIQPLNNLPVDAKIWEDAHARHEIHRQVHVLSGHRPGIVTGLDVLPCPSPQAALIVTPGIAIDELGNVIRVEEPQKIVLDQEGTNFVSVTFKLVEDPKSVFETGGGVQVYKSFEKSEITVSKQRPGPDQVEIARILRSKKNSPITAASATFDPDEDEINLLQRQQAFPICTISGKVAELSLVPSSGSGDILLNRIGLMGFIRETNFHGFHCAYAGRLSAAMIEPENQPLLIYGCTEAAFNPLSSTQMQLLNDYLDQGGVLFLEASRGASHNLFRDLVTTLNGKLSELQNGHPLFKTHYIFPGTPVGGNPGGRIAADLQRGIIVSNVDYGAAWQGEVTEGGREVVRGAIEFGMNILAYAAQRIRTRETDRHLRTAK